MLLALLFLSLMKMVPPQNHGTVLLRDVRIVDPQTQTVTPGHVLLVGPRILRVFHGALPKDIGAQQVIDGQHKWLMPALTDMHVHATGDPAPTEPEADDLAMEPTQVAARMASVGVTAFLDLGSPADAIFAARDSIAKELWPSSRHASVMAAGPVWIQAAKTDDSHGHSAAAFVEGSWDAPDKIAKFIEAWHPQVVKVIYDHSEGRNSMDKPTLLAIVSAAHRRNTKVVAHIQLWQDMRDAVNAGVDAVTHLDDDGDVPDDVVKLLLKHKTCVIPTLGVQMGLADLVDKPELLADPLLQKLETPEFLERFRHPENFGPKAKFWLDWQRKSRVTYLRSVKKLFDAGVCVLPGSDSGNIGVIQGWSLHRELELYQEAGVPAWRILRAATVDAAGFLKAHGFKFGRLQPGNRANLLLLDGDPTLSVANTRRIDLTWTWAWRPH